MKRLLNISAYLVFGVLTTVINIVSYKICLDLNLDYRVSAFLAFILAVAFAFVTNRKYVFVGQASIWQEAAAFLGVRILTFLVNLVGLIFLVQFLQIDKFISQILINVVIIVLNYVLSKYFVFNLKSISNYFKSRAV
ncbi:GtrA family protein [Bacillota bacterium LX-D]|nr:GtrA family protein [Bacillota bacterium LX-D]